MTRDEAVLLLTSGAEGVREWNRARESGGDTPSLAGLDLSDVALREVNLSGLDLSGVRLDRAKLPAADLSSTNLSSASLLGASLPGAKLEGARLHQVDLGKATLLAANLAKAELRDCRFDATDFSGANLEAQDLQALDLSSCIFQGANLKSAVLRGSKLVNADLSEAQLCDAVLDNAVLANANLQRADLSGAESADADFSGAKMTRCFLARATLDRSRFVGSDLAFAELLGAHLHGANLYRASLVSADLTRASLVGANLREADITKSRLIRSDLTDACVEGAVVADVQQYELAGFPKPPESLRLDAFGTRTLTGEDARAFFAIVATVEVLLDRSLAPVELGMLHFHHAELQYKRVANGVYFVGHRFEDIGSVLRFQGHSYDAVYLAIPDFLAPFRLAKAIDWAETVKGLPAESRRELMSALVTEETASGTGKWLFAERMSTVFEGFRNSRVLSLKDGRQRGLLVSVASNEKMMERLVKSLPPAWDGVAPLQITTGPKASIEIQTTLIRGDVYRMRDSFSAGQAGAMGPGAQASHMTFQQIWNQHGASVDLVVLQEELSLLREAMRRDSRDPEHDIAIGEVAAAEAAARTGNGPKALEHLKAAGRSALDVATKIGARVAAAAIRAAAGLAGSDA